MNLCKALTARGRPLLGNVAFPLQNTLTPLAVVPQRGFKSDLRERGIEWNEPKKLPFYHPKKVGDLEAYDKPDKTRPTLPMRFVADEYDESSPAVQQLLSLEFAPNAATLRVAKYDAIRLVQRHQYDNGSILAQIANDTCFIRMCQCEDFQWRLQKFPERRSFLNDRIARRRKNLKHLRRIDYKCFEWLLEKLNIIYKPPPSLLIKKVTRHECLERLVNMRCDSIRKKRMAIYREQLEEQRASFEKEKFDALTWIKKTQEDLGVAVDVNPDTGMIEPPEERRITIWQRVFGPFMEK